MNIIHKVVPTAAKAATPAAMAKIVSSGLAGCTAAATTGRGIAGAGRAAGCCAAAGANGAAVVVRGAATGAGVPTGGRGGAAPGTPPGPPGGSVGNLMVGAAEGLGGKLMRTVSFLGWTLPVDFFIGVTG